MVVSWPREMLVEKFCYTNCIITIMLKNECDISIKETLLLLKMLQVLSGLTILLLSGLTKKIGNCCVKLKFPESLLEEEEVLP